MSLRIADPWELEVMGVAGIEKYTSDVKFIRIRPKGKPASPHEVFSHLCWSPVVQTFIDEVPDGYNDLPAIFVHHTRDGQAWATYCDLTSDCLKRVGYPFKLEWPGSPDGGPAVIRDQRTMKSTPVVLVEDDKLMFLQPGNAESQSAIGPWESIYNTLFYVDGILICDVKGADLPKEQKGLSSEVPLASSSKTLQKEKDAPKQTSKKADPETTETSQSNKLRITPEGRGSYGKKSDIEMAIPKKEEEIRLSEGFSKYFTMTTDNTTGLTSITFVKKPGKSDTANLLDLEVLIPMLRSYKSSSAGILIGHPDGMGPPPQPLAGQVSAYNRGLHGTPYKGIHGHAGYGCNSIFVNNDTKYDDGQSLIYEGSGQAGQHMRMNSDNLCLVISMFTKNPVRVLRGPDYRRNCYPKATDGTGSYDGLYDVTDFWVTLKSNKGSSHRVLRYKLMKREHDPMGPKFTLKPPDKCKGKSNVDAEGDTSMLDESTAT